MDKEAAQELHKWWKEHGEPDAEGHRTKSDEESQESQSCDSKGDGHGGSKRTMSAQDALELLLMGVVGTAITIFSGGSMQLQPAGVVTPTNLAPYGQPQRIGDPCPYC